MTDRLKTVYPPKTSFCGGYNENFQSKIFDIGIPLQPHFFYIKAGFKGVYISWTCFPDATLWVKVCYEITQALLLFLALCIVLVDSLYLD